MIDDDLQVRVEAVHRRSNVRAEALETKSARLEQAREHATAIRLAERSLEITPYLEDAYSRVILDHRNTRVEVTRRVRLGMLGGIAFVGIVAAITARAVKDSRLRIPSTDVHKLARANPALKRHLMSGVRWGMTGFLEHLDSQSENTV